MTDTLSESEIHALKHTVWAGCEIHCYDSVDSTNAKAKELAEAGCPDGTLVVAGQQTAGRGRRGRSWESPADCGIFMTLVLKPDICPDNASMLTLLAALAVSQAVSEVTGEPAGIKWPNDIVMHGKKVCGILTEMCAEAGHIRHVLVGIGINVHNERFPEEIAHRAASLLTECGRHFRRAEIIGKVLERFEHAYGIFLETQDLEGLKETYNALLVNRNREVKVLDPAEPFEGTALGITGRGELLVNTGSTLRAVSSGEVSVRGIYGYV